jgi:hypothetical protein
MALPLSMVGKDILPVIGRRLQTQENCHWRHE